MLHMDNKAQRTVRYATAAALLLAFVLSFFSCIRETFTAWFPERMDGIDGWVEYLPMLPGFLRYLLIPSAVLLLIGKKWTDILSTIFLALPLLAALAKSFLYNILQPMGGLGSYHYEYTLLGYIVVGLLLLGYAGQIIMLCAAGKRSRAA